MTYKGRPPNPKAQASVNGRDTHRKAPPGRPINGKRPDSRHTVRDAALAYLRDGFVPIPIENKKSLVTWKEFQERQPTEQEIEGWYKQWPDAGVALVCGWNGLAVVDVDQASLTDRLRFVLGDQTRLVRTPRGGLHIYVTEPLPSKSGPVVAGLVDVKAEGGYVAAPPTQGYELLNAARVMRAKYSGREMATRLVLGVIKASAEDDPLRQFLVETLPKPADKKIADGARNTTLTSRAGAMRRDGATPDEIEEQLLEINTAQCIHPLDTDEVHTIAYSMGRYEPGPKRCDDIGNGQRLVDKFGEEIRYVYKWKKWLVWRGTHWVEDEGELIDALAEVTARSIFDEARDANNEGDQKTLAAHAARTASWGSRQAMVKSAQNLVAIRAEDLDTNNWLLNCANGTIDLRTGNLQPHNPDDYITRVIPTRYDPDALAPRWEQFLEEVILNEDTREFIQRAAGYSLTGVVSEQVFFFLYGMGDNGKTTFVETLQHLLAGYAKAAAPGLIFAKKEDSHPTELADLHGARFVVVAEAGAGRALNEERIKQITGGDTIKARRLYEDYWQFKPTHKFWLIANHKPAIKGTENAIWRRPKLIPFTVKIEAARKDKDLGSYLEGNESEGILAWAVRGCLRWYQEGDLKESDEVKAATEEYKAEQDVVGQWVDERCVLEPYAETQVSDLYKSYTDWCSENGQRYPLNKQKFGHRLSELELVIGHNRYGSTRLGVRLKAPRDDDWQEDEA